MSTTTPGADQLQALINYSNNKTGASDTTLSDVVTRLVAGYGEGGIEPKLVTVTGGSAKDILDQCRSAVDGSTSIFVQNALQEEVGTSDYCLFYGIYIGITNAGRTRYLNTAYRKTTSGSYGFVELTSTSTTGGTTPNNAQFYVWALDGIFEQPQ